MKHYKSLDSLRAVAVILVLIWHFLPRAVNPILSALELYLIPTGVFAVTMFFVLSGYLITAILLDNKEQSGDKLKIIKNFMIRRSLRIFPIYFLLLALMIILKFPFRDNELLYHASFTSNFYCFYFDWPNYIHTWSLAVEEQFYLLWPWLIILIGSRNHKFVYLACIVISVISAWYFGVPGDLMFDSARTAITTTNLAPFAVGGFYASLVRSDEGKLLISKWIWPLAFMALGLIYYWKLCTRLDLPVVLPYLRILMVSIVSTSVIHGLLNLKDGFSRSVIEHRVLTGIGKISYGVYLYHIPVLFLFKDIIMVRMENAGVPANPFYWFPFYCITVIAISYVSYQLIERPILNYKQRFSLDKAE